MSDERLKELAESLKAMDHPPLYWEGSETLKVGFHTAPATGSCKLSDGSEAEIRVCHCVHGPVVINTTVNGVSRSVQLGAYTLIDIARSLGVFGDLQPVDEETDDDQE